MDRNFLIGESLFKQKKYEKSLKYFHSSFENNPSSIPILSRLGITLMILKKYEKANFYFGKIVELNDKFFDIHYNRGVCHYHLQNYKDAIDSFNLSININKKFFEAYIQLGSLYKLTKQIDEAIEVYNQAKANLPKNDSIYINLSELYFIKKNYKLSINYANKALTFNPNNHLAFINIGLCHLQNDNFEIAINFFQKSISLNSNTAMPYNYIGMIHRYMGDYQLANEYFNKAIVIDNNYNDAFFNLAHIYLSQNQFEQGWFYYEYRWGKSQNRPTFLKFNKPIWNNKKKYKNILIWGEQGLGEEILFSSIFNDLLKIFENVLVCVDIRLCKFLTENYPNIEFFDKSKKINEDLFDCHLPICSLGLYFRKNINDFYGKNNYLKIIPKNFSTKKKKFRCGISWKSINEENGKARSVDLKYLSEILKLNDIEFFDIQYSDEIEEINYIKKNYAVDIQRIQNLDCKNDIYSLLQFINTCDFIITISNTNAHLSAVLGIPTLILLPKEMGDIWYWNNNINNQNLWHPSLVKFKQKTQNDWGPPIRNLEKYILNQFLLK